MGGTLTAEFLPVRRCDACSNAITLGVVAVEAESEAHQAIMVLLSSNERGDLVGFDLASLHSKQSNLN